MNGTPNVPTPPTPEGVINAVISDGNTVLNLAVKPVNDGLGWINQAVGFVASWPSRTLSALRPNGGM
jgi:hypothetical protein